MTKADTESDLAEYLAESFFPNDAVQPLEIAERRGLTWNLGSYEDAFDGLLELKNQKFHIYLNSNRLGDSDSSRARFTAAHELGHYYIDEHRNALKSGVSPHPSFTEFRSNELVERQADAFAANLLMPINRFRSVARSHSVSINSIKAIADNFQTSLMSTAIRYARSNVASVAVMLWNSKGRCWCWSSDDVFALTQNRAFRSIDRVPADSLTSLSLTSQSSEAIERGTVLSQWFPKIHSGSLKDRICREEATSLGRFGTLTLLHLADF